MPMPRTCAKSRAMAGSRCSTSNPTHTSVCSSNSPDGCKERRETAAKGWELRRSLFRVLKFPSMDSLDRHLAFLSGFQLE